MDESVVPVIYSAADEVGIPRHLLLGLAKAESEVSPRAERRRDWPDVSFGLYQQTVKWADEGDHSDSPQNIAFVADLYFDPVHASKVAAKKLKALLAKHRDEVRTLWAYNKPANPDLVAEKSKIRYRESLEWAKTHVEEGITMDELYKAIYNAHDSTIHYNPGGALVKKWKGMYKELGPALTGEKTVGGKVYQVFLGGILRWDGGENATLI